MARVAFDGHPVMTAGDLPAVGETAPDFVLTGKDLADITHEPDYEAALCALTEM